MKTKHIHGQIALQFLDHKLKDLCVQHIPNFNADQFTIVAVKVFAEREFIVTIFAHDNQGNDDPQQVKKFKIETLSHQQFYNYVEGYNFTLIDDSLQLSGLDVINK